MNDRYKKIKLEVEEGITLASNETNILISSTNSKTSENYQKLEDFDIETSEDVELEVSEFGDELTIRVINLASKSFTIPPIPEGYKHITGKWNNGFVIERVSDGSQFVWIPVMTLLDTDCYLPGKTYGCSFGRRNFLDDDFSDKGYSEGFLFEQWESIKNYGGFYISRYNISKGAYGEPQSVKGFLPWTCIDFYEAKKVSASFENSGNVKSHLTYGAEYDSILQWLIETKAMSEKEIATNSTGCGNFSCGTHHGKVTKTGSNYRWEMNNIYDLAGNVSEWTQEEAFYRVIRGGSCYESGSSYPVAKREPCYPKENNKLSIGFRIALYIK